MLQVFRENGKEKRDFVLHLRLKREKTFKNAWRDFISILSIMQSIEMTMGTMSSDHEHLCCCPFSVFPKPAAGFAQLCKVFLELLPRAAVTFAMPTIVKNMLTCISLCYPPLPRMMHHSPLMEGKK